MAWMGRDDETRHHDQVRIREVDQSEFDALAGATAMLRSLSHGNAYADVVDAEEALREALRGATHAWATGAGSPPLAAIRAVHTTFKAFLSAARSFEDRWASYLSAAVGRNHPVYSKFKDAVQAERDRQFAYRLCCALRDVTEHAGDVINIVEAAAGPGVTGAPTYLVRFALDGPKLAAVYPRLWSEVRAELEQATEPIAVGAVASAALRSCERSYAALLNCVQPHLDRACEVLQSMHDEAAARGGRAANVISVPVWDERIGHNVVANQWVEIQWACQIQKNLAEARQPLKGEPANTGSSDYPAVKATDVIPNI